MANALAKIRSGQVALRKTKVDDRKQSGWQISDKTGDNRPLYLLQFSFSSPHFPSSLLSSFPPSLLRSTCGGPHVKYDCLHPHW